MNHIRLLSLLLVTAMLFLGCTPADDSTPAANPITTSAEVLLTTAPAAEPETLPPETEPAPLQTEPAPITTEAETEPPEPEYIQVPRFYDKTAEEAAAILRDYGLESRYTYENNAAKKDRVYSVSFSGHFDDSTLYISPGTTVTLRVSLGPKEPVNATAKGDKVIYLTFDDGPTGKRTYEVLEILEKYDVKATFFLVGQFCAYYPKSVKAIHDAGHMIACHSYTHDFDALYSTEEGFRGELELWESTITDILGGLPEKHLFRFPGGSPQAKQYGEVYYSLLDTLEEKEYLAFDWTLSNNDVWATSRNGEQTPDQYVRNSFLTMLNNYEKYTSLPKIVLTHETNKYTVGMLEWAIQLLIERGYTFATLDELDDGWYL